MMFAVSDSRKDIINAEFADCNRNLAKKVASKSCGSSKNRQDSSESCRFYLLPIHSSLFPKNTCRFLESNR